MKRYVELKAALAAEFKKVWKLRCAAKLVWLEIPENYGDHIIDGRVSLTLPVEAIEGIIEALVYTGGGK